MPARHVMGQALSEHLKFARHAMAAARFSRRLGKCGSTCLAHGAVEPENCGPRAERVAGKAAFGTRKRSTCVFLQAWRMVGEFAYPARVMPEPWALQPVTFI